MPMNGVGSQDEYRGSGSSRSRRSARGREDSGTTMAEGYQFAHARRV